MILEVFLGDEQISFRDNIGKSIWGRLFTTYGGLSTSSVALFSVDGDSGQLSLGRALLSTVSFLPQSSSEEHVDSRCTGFRRNIIGGSRTLNSVLVLMTVPIHK